MSLYTNPNPTVAYIKKMSTNPVDRLQNLLDVAKQKSDTQTAALIDALLTIIDGLHTRVCELEHPRSGSTQSVDVSWNSPVAMPPERGTS